MSFKSKYGYIGLAVHEKEFIAEGLNEAGLSAGLFYFPNYGSYQLYDEKYNSTTIADLQLVSWILSQFATVDEVKANINKVRVVSLMGGDGSEEAIHWRVGDNSGKQIVIEIEKGVPHVYDNPIGVLTNAPNFPWHLSNLSNYINLTPINPPAHKMADFMVNPIGHGNGFLGLPGDFTPPSRFVRAAFFKSTAPMLATARQTMLQCFHILNNFDIPIGMNFPKNEIPDLPSATQWTSVIDLTNKVVYYKTFDNNNIRMIDLKNIDFGKVKYQYQKLDEPNSQPVEAVAISQ
jgi:choloylglycine hydrolase